MFVWWLWWSLFMWMDHLVDIANGTDVRADSLTPPYFNLAEGRNVTASATCGVGTEEPELYCKLVGSSSEHDAYFNVIQGQYCDVCDPRRPDKMHPPEFAVDGSGTWWQSPPLSRGMKYNEVNLTIDFGQEFHVAYIYIRMGNSPRPGLWVLEKSVDYGKTYTPWQYFSDSPTDCEIYFGKESLQPITKDDSVICTTEYSKIVPLEGGEIPIKLLENRPSANHYFNSTVLQEWTRATNVRLRFLRTKNLLGHLMSVQRQDPTVTRRYFYSIKDISIGGRCMCNGHADTCDISDPNDPRILLCRCQHHTCGAKCNICCPGFEQKKWRQSKINDPFACEKCNCFQHSDECIYDEEVDRKHLSLDINGRYEGGGVCQNCQHNTEGINCNKCKPTYFRPSNKFWNETDVCQPCQCNYFYSTGNCAEGSGQCECRKEYEPPYCRNCSFGYYGYPDCKPCECFLNGTRDLQCKSQDGQCPCLYNFGGKYCKECAVGYYGFPECKRCECNPEGSTSLNCHQETGNCSCKNNFAGKHCDQCQDGYYNYPQCTYCNCDIKGTEKGICNKETGECFCKEGYGGELCNFCLPGYYGYPDCKPCNCSKDRSLGPTCDVTGKCSCLVNYGGTTCHQCSPGYYAYPDCLPCNCDSSGADGVSCDSEGKCKCKYNFAGLKCDVCMEGFYNFPACEDCNCNPAGVVKGFAGCGSVPAGELCQCKERVEGRICNKCRPLYWNLNQNNPEGCEECRCNIGGTLGGVAVCDTESGQCICKPLVVARGCTECADGTFNLQEENLFGCSDCDCDIGGSINSICDKQSGQCPCHPRVTGRNCKEPLKAHYFPTLYQYQYEAEDARTPANTQVRYSYNESIFPNYSWRGYAVFSPLQNKIIQDVYILKPSLYRMVLRYINNNPETVLGTIKIVPDNPNDNEQEFRVQFANTSVPTFVTVSGATGNTPSPFVMNPGVWQISIEVNKNLLLDYFVLLPEDFYLATILNKKVEKPCTIGENDLCKDYTYLNVTGFDRTFGVGGFIQAGRKIEKLREYFQDTEHLSIINVGNRVPLLNLAQPNMTFNISINKPGLYVILLQYVTPLTDLRTHKVKADVKIENTSEEGNLILYACSYSTLCRQVITNSFGGIGVYHVSGNDLQVTLDSANANVGIHSIVAVPYSEWTLDYIKPKMTCIRKDGKCLKASFITPPETKKIQPEESNINNSVTIGNETYLYLNPDFDSVDLKGKVPSPGVYTFIVHYYQPNFRNFDVSVILQNGQFYEASLPINFCPSPSGCRAVISQADGNNRFSLLENFMMTLTQPKTKSIYIDYILVIPADFHSDRYLQEEDVDRTGEFISTCGSNHFNVDTANEGFCRESVFSITAEHNSGALPCQCDYVGSLSFECNKFGGQCPCKPNIIGRTCEACKTGYYGFPDCKPCNCPSTAYCLPSTGQCICPPHVTGERCDQCEPLTYGFDPIIGCAECSCNPLGTQSSLQCDLLNGTCPCHPNIEGRQCEHCKPGHYSYPYCESCNCDQRGTTDEICDPLTAQCFCKRNVVGPRCETCREGSFNLQNTNIDGCTECFCFGKTTRCTSSKLMKINIVQMDGWQVVTLNASRNLEVAPLNITVESVKQDAIGIDLGDLEDENVTVYFSAPSEYIGKKLTTYGGFLNYTILYTIGNKGSAVGGPDVILQGAKTYLTYSNYEQPPPAIEFPTMLQFVQSNFELPAGIPAKRDHIMEVLEDLKGLYIRATYWTSTYTTRLSLVIQENAEPYQYTKENNGEIAHSVEQCQCPPNYQGLSCEECAPGYYRVETGPHGGYCVPCQCNGHAEECDVKTGVCFNCTHHTRGDHCELCEVGYHGNSLAGTPKDCLICACPLPVNSNNFATGCDVSSDGERISCDCVDNYVGARCQGCGPGYYGDPQMLGDYCKPCNCSGNINPEDPNSCDTRSGKCLRCLNNTFGEACALCAPGFYGDAVEAKDCQSCICDDVGTDHCNSFTGECVCKPNVVGEKCDRCALEHYGFQSGNGCTPCLCAEASDSTQCDDVTGQCRCKEGVTGRACDKCSAGYWNYTTEGCVSCGCKSEYSLGFGCNALTGQCECLQGVTGEKCDQCPHRWAFVKDYGCHECDSCTHNLLDVTDVLSTDIDPIIIEFDSANSGYFTRRKLENMKESLNSLQTKFDQVNPAEISLTPFIKGFDDLENKFKLQNRRVNYSLIDGNNLKNESDILKEMAEELWDESGNVEEEAIVVIDDINKITFQLNEEDGREVSNALQEANQILDDIKRYNLTAREQGANNMDNKVEGLLKNVTNFKAPGDNLGEKVQEIKENLKDINAKLDDLYNQTRYSLNKAMEAEAILEKSGKEKFKKKFADIAQQSQDSKNNLDVAEVLNSNSTKFNEESQEKLNSLRDLLEKVREQNDDFSITLDKHQKEIENVVKIQPKVKEHAEGLSNRAMELNNILSETRDFSDNAVRAANAYKDIVDAVKNARAAAIVAQTDANSAEVMLGGVEDKAYNAHEKSQTSLRNATDLYVSTKNNLEPQLEQAIEAYRPVQVKEKKNEAKLNELEKLLQNIKSEALDSRYKAAIEKAKNAITHVEDIDSTANETFSELPNETQKAKSLPKDVDDTNRNVLQAEKQLNSVKEKVTDIIKAMDSIPNTQAQLKDAAENIKNNLKKLNEQIILARDTANQIKIGMKFFPNTSLELRNPPNLEDLSTSTRISGYFKTDKLKGMIWYLGNPVGTNLRRTKRDDYMVLIIQNGYPVLKMDVGNGPEQLINEKFVSDNQWYQFIIDKTGHNVKLSIREELPGKQENITTSEMTLDGAYSIFNLDKNKSKLFVGSVPLNYQIQEDIDMNSFDGEIEDLVIGDQPVSLWNFVNGFENNHGAYERNKLVNLAPSTGLRFNGNGYAILNARSYSFRTRSDIQLSFKTFATEGLLFLAGQADQGKTFIALELRNGKILYQYNLGSETKTWHTPKAYNDGNWHTIKAIRDGNKGKFEVDGENIPDTSKTISGSTIEPIETVSFGGYPNRHRYTDVTNIKFDGCIDNVVIMGSPMDLSQNIQAFDVTPGCPEKFARMVSFAKHRPGYVRRDKLHVDNNFKLGLKFKTKEKEGLIFYGTDQLRDSNISLALKDGHLVLISQNIELTSKETFNDSEWHVVTVMHNNNELRVDFDDWGQPLIMDSPPPDLRIPYGNLYIGGVPMRMTLNPTTVGSSTPFSGCIVDVTINGDVINFANSTDRYNEILGKCVLDEIIKETVPGVHKIATLPPLEIPTDIPVTLSPNEYTDIPSENIDPRRGDGAPDYVAKTTTPKPHTQETCALPLQPADDDQDYSGIYRFGTQKDSRLEFNQARGKYRKQFDFSLEFKSSYGDGIIFYVSGNSHMDYVALLLDEGRVIFTFSGGNGPAVMRSEEAFNDNTWHFVQISRSVEGQGKLVIDGKQVAEGRAPTPSHKMDLQPPYYIGGLRPEDHNVVLGKLNSTAAFRGCVKNFQMNSKAMENPVEYGVIPCSENVENGVYFPYSTNNNFIKLKERFKVGKIFNLKLKIKPRNNSGLLIAVHARGDYFLMEMVDGVMQVSVGKEGHEPIIAVYQPPKPYYFCDGHWHTIQAVKSHNVVTLSVDNVFTEPIKGHTLHRYTNTASPLFLGGHKHISRLKILHTRMPYVGCIRDVVINNYTVDILPKMTEGNVTVGFCPTN